MMNSLDDIVNLFYKAVKPSTIVEFETVARPYVTGDVDEDTKKWSDVAMYAYMWHALNVGQNKQVKPFDFYNRVKIIYERGLKGQATPIEDDPYVCEAIKAIEKVQASLVLKAVEKELTEYNEEHVTNEENVPESPEMPLNKESEEVDIPTVENKPSYGFKKKKKHKK